MIRSLRQVGNIAISWEIVEQLIKPANNNVQARLRMVVLNVVISLYLKNLTSETVIINLKIIIKFVNTKKEHSRNTQTLTIEGALHTRQQSRTLRACKRSFDIQGHKLKNKSWTHQPCRDDNENIKHEHAKKAAMPGTTVNGPELPQIRRALRVFNIIYN